MTDKVVDISVKSLARIHQRNRDLDLLAQRQEQEIIILQDALTKLVLPKRQTSGITEK